jgi:uncharacterized membrane protein
MMFLWLPFLFLIPAALVWMAWSNAGTGCCGARTHAMPVQAPSANAPDPIEIARERLARGEISSAEFEEIRRVLG